MRTNSGRMKNGRYDFSRQQRIEKQRSLWFQEYEDELAKRDDHQPGRVNWETAQLKYSEGKSPEQAAQEVTEPYKP